MEYERIHKVQTGMISPSKLRMKLTGAHSQKKKDGSNCNSSRTSPSRLEDTEFVKDSLLAAPNGDSNEEAASSLQAPPIKSDCVTTDAIRGDGNLMTSKEFAPKENGECGRLRMHLVPKGEGNSSSVHPVRAYEDENLDYDSTSSFEFYKGERSLQHSGTRSFSRPMSSKWDDAEKWIMSRQNVQLNVTKKGNLQNHVIRGSGANMVRVAPELMGSENRQAVKRVDFCQPPSLIGSAKFAFSSHGATPISGPANGTSSLINLCPESKDLQEVDVDNLGLPCTEDDQEEPLGNNAGVPAIRSVSMRDTGTEMTPIPSQEPSRSVTPVSATSPLRSPTSSMPSTPPLRSPTSSMPSTPRRVDPTPTPTGHSSNSLPHLAETGRKELSEQELKLKTRREIVALGVQLGKTNIAAWASTDEKEKRGISGNGAMDGNCEEIEYAKRAAAWEEAEKSKHAARFMREEVRIQAWESRQKAKLEAEMRKMEAQIEQMRAHAQAKMIKKIALTRQMAEEKRSAAEARKNRQAEKTAAQVEYIQQTGVIPSSRFSCCG